MQLICRGHTYNVATKSRTVKPSVINWRYCVPGETYETEASSLPFGQSHAMNWRYQSPTPW